jgi:hypothetical protein
MGHAIWPPVPAPRRRTDLDRREYSNRRPPLSTTTLPHPRNHLPHSDVLPRPRDVAYREVSRKQATSETRRMFRPKQVGTMGAVRLHVQCKVGERRPRRIDPDQVPAAGYVWHAGQWPGPESPTACRPQHCSAISVQELLQILRILCMVHRFIHDKLTLATGRPNECCHLAWWPAVQSW